MNEIKTKNVTINELAETLGIEYGIAASVIKFLVGLGAVKDVGAKPQEKGVRGKPSRIYELPQVVELQFFTDDESSNDSSESSVSSETVIAPISESLPVSVEFAPVVEKLPVEPNPIPANNIVEQVS